MQRCSSQRAFYDTLTDQNMLICQDARCEHLYDLVNPYICTNCGFKNLIETDWIDEPAFEPRPEDTIKYLFKTTCEQCPNFNPNKQNCSLIRNSKVLYEILSNPKYHCPRKLW